MCMIYSKSFCSSLTQLILEKSGKPRFYLESVVKTISTYDLFAKLNKDILPVDIALVQQGFQK